MKRNINLYFQDQETTVFYFYDNNRETCFDQFSTRLY